MLDLSAGQVFPLLSTCVPLSLPCATLSWHPLRWKLSLLIWAWSCLQLSMPSTLKTLLIGCCPWAGEWQRISPVCPFLTASSGFPRLAAELCPVARAVGAGHVQRLCWHSWGSSSFPPSVLPSPEWPEGTFCQCLHPPAQCYGQALHPAHTKQAWGWSPSCSKESQSLLTARLWASAHKQPFCWFRVLACFFFCFRTMRRNAIGSFTCDSCFLYLLGFPDKVWLTEIKLYFINLWPSEESPFQMHLNRKCFPDAVRFCRSESTALLLKELPLAGIGAGVCLITQSHPLDIWFPDALKWYLATVYFVHPAYVLIFYSLFSGHVLASSYKKNRE